jgi:UDP-N-acetylglucosamine 2-epimerase (non-hydrolysing)
MSRANERLVMHAGGAGPNFMKLASIYFGLRGSLIRLEQVAIVAITNSGEVQGETTFVGTPCLILRNGTERPVAVDIGTHSLIGDDPRALEPCLARIPAGADKRGQVPELWDGNAGARVGRMIAAALQ